MSKTVAQPGHAFTIKEQNKQTKRKKKKKSRLWSCINKTEIQAHIKMHT